MRQSEARHVAEPLGDCAYAFSKSKTHPKARAGERSAIEAVDGPRQRSPPEPQGLETDSS